MGQSKGGGYTKKETLTPEQSSLLNQILGQAGNFSNQAAGAFNQVLSPEGGKAIEQQALNRYQQQILPSIMNAYGSNSKSSSALNQALASSGSNLSTDIQAQLEQLKLGAASGLAGLGQGQSQLGLGTAGFAYMPKQMPFWQQLLLAGTQGGAQAAASLPFLMK